MRCIFSTLVVALLIFHSPRVHSEDAEVTIFNQWPRGFYGEISIALEDDVVDGWQLTVSFSKPVKRLSVWNAKVDSISDDKKQYILKNRFWNKKLKAERPLKFRFLGHKAKKGENQPTVTAEFTRLGEGSGF